MTSILPRVTNDAIYNTVHHADMIESAGRLRALAWYERNVTRSKENMTSSTREAMRRSAQLR